MSSKQPPPRPPKRPELGASQASQGDPRAPIKPRMPSVELGTDDASRSIKPKLELSVLGSNQSAVVDGNSAADPPTPVSLSSDADSLDVKKEVTSSPRNNGSSSVPTEKDAKPPAINDKAAEDEKKSPETTKLKKKLLETLDVISNIAKDLESVEETTKSLKDDTKVKDLKRQPCIPTLKQINWYSFKNRWANDMQLHAIEVLRGPAKYFPDKDVEERKADRLRNLGLVPARLQFEEDREDAASTQGIPERIRINSVPILAILADVDPVGRSDISAPIVHLRPYKQLIRLEDKLKIYLWELEEKWGAAEEADRLSKENMTLKGVDAQSETGDKSLHTDLPTNTESAVTHTEEKEVQKGQVPSASDPLTDSVEALRDLRCLMEFMKVYIYPTLDGFRDMTARKVRFTDLWYLFPQGEEIVHAPKRRGGTGSKKDTESRAYQTLYRVYDRVGGRRLLSNSPDDDQASDPEGIKRVRALVPGSVNSKANGFWITCYYIDWDSDSFVPASHTFNIGPFQGERDITSLDLYPTKYHQNFSATRKKLLERGRRFSVLTKPVPQRYSGRTHVCRPCGCSFFDEADEKVEVDQLNVTGEVMIDFATAIESQPWLSPATGVRDLSEYCTLETVESWRTSYWKDKDHIKLDSVQPDIIRQDVIDENKFRNDAAQANDFIRRWESYDENDEEDPIDKLETEDFLVLLPKRVLGYAFRERTFVALDIDHLTDPSPDPEGFRALALPEGHQHMVEAVVSDHFNMKKAYEMNGQAIPEFDVIEGKGRGLVILLHGAPGVGKTSTAECVAKATNRPLFPITCGDLGLAPESVEKSLAEKFKLAAKWDCVLLLDEADIFLARRDKVNLERNALVSVFLRVLEYYDGILFLTTNRVGTFDDAFKSRIHVNLLYPELTKEQTLSIWKKNLARLKKIEKARSENTNVPRMLIDKKAIMTFADKHFDKHQSLGFGKWNGRQIRNAFKTAAALAYHNAKIRSTTEAPCLSIDLFKDVARTTDTFDKYINETHRNNERDRAKGNKERSDHFHLDLSRDIYSGPAQPSTPPISRQRGRYPRQPETFQQTPQSGSYNAGYQEGISYTQQAIGGPSPNNLQHMAPEMAPAQGYQLAGLNPSMSVHPTYAGYAQVQSTNTTPANTAPTYMIDSDDSDDDDD